jgi:Tfp pilus assembly major pilin PilA
MKKHGNARRAANDDLEIPELGSDFFANAVMGKYYEKTMAKSNVVRIEADLSRAFPNERAVNQALRELLKFRETLVQITSNKVRRKKTA